MKPSYCESLVTPHWPGCRPVHVHCLPRAPMGFRSPSAAGHRPPSEPYSSHWLELGRVASAPVPLNLPLHSPSSPPSQLVQDRGPSRTRLSLVLGPLCAGNRVSDALYDPKARAFPSPGRLPLTRPASARPCCPTAFLTHSRWEAQRSSLSRSRAGEKPVERLRVGLFLRSGRGQSWVPGLLGFEPPDQTRSSSALTCTSYFNLL